MDFSIQSLGAGKYKIEAQFEVPPSMDTAWSVLTDYENIPRFITSMEKSRVISKNKNDLLVEQEAVVNIIWLLNQKRTVVLKVKEIPFSKIIFEDTLHEQIESYRGYWEIRPEKNKLIIYYVLWIKTFEMPMQFVSENIMKESVLKNLEAIRAEIKRRDGERIEARN